ncbi:MAG: quinolinate synthase NadA [Armatimonadetes bacterium]|nr:quinolinate synthase NadA [Armatimonadota bacterium]
MFQEPISSTYTDLTEEQTRDRIRGLKKELGDKVVILGHHYQRDEIIEHADYRGDSYKLAKDAASHPSAEFIVFCGVHFMAESADILTPETQKVILPNLAAGCSMADMANNFQVRSAWKQLGETLGAIEGKIIPVTYINSAANLKAFVGEHGGTVCTSTNAPKAVKWALEKGEKVLFFPDQHLGRNTCANLGIDPETEMALWDPFKPLGGNTPEKLAQSKAILWKGHCSVHQRFTVDQIRKAREEHPGIKILVHPECPIEVVRESDLFGSTEYIINQVKAAPAGSVWGIGTEINLVSRLAKEHPEQTIVCLDPQICPCSTMYRIHPSYLLWSLDRIAAGEPANIIEVPQAIKEPALVALKQMLEL